MIRTYTIEDDGDEVQVQLFEDGVQMGGAVFPDIEGADSWDAAVELAEGWVGNVGT